MFISGSTDDYSGLPGHKHLNVHCTMYIAVVDQF